MKKRRQGFTLVELLAVIVILAIILAIAIPSITGLIDAQRKNAFESNVKMLIRGIDYQLLTDPGSVTVGDNLENVDRFGGDPALYDTFEITNLQPVTVTVVAASGGNFTGWQATGATYTSVNVQAIP
ncbi:MAG: prepilin-type N-terminal cleavage/methylation domain-containing protein [Bacilli bacterium]|jgi:prepilin-type N-terminal cleavage/methylation domain-containing protein